MLKAGSASRTKTVIFIGIIIMAVLVIMVPRYILPWAGDQVANWIPKSWLMMAGDETLAILDESFFFRLNWRFRISRNSRRI